MRPRAPHDARARLLLRRAGAPHVGAHHCDAVLHLDGRHLDRLGPHRLLARLRRGRRRRHRQPRLLPALHAHGRVHPHGIPDGGRHRHHPRHPLRRVPDDVCHHLPRAHHRRLRGPRALQGLPHLHRAVAHPRLLPLRPLGVVAQWVPGGVGRQGLCGGHRGAHLGGLCGARLHLCRGPQTVRVRGGAPPHAGPPQPHFRGARHRAAVGRVVRLQRRVGHRVQPPGGLCPRQLVARRLHRHGDVDVHRVGAHWQAHADRVVHRRHRGPGDRHPRCGVCAAVGGVSDRVHRLHPVLRLRDAARQAQVGRRARRVGRARHGGALRDPPPRRPRRRGDRGGEEGGGILREAARGLHRHGRLLVPGVVRASRPHQPRHAGRARRLGDRHGPRRVAPRRAGIRRRGA
mmetsp:Transcript_37268/g.72716  ORF Transcript_37268/g.72716 Transcript_37268/m.72716 type:complete len:402 (-) Transcript_37268:207-1412(-)